MAKRNAKAKKKTSTSSKSVKAHPYQGLKYYVITALTLSVVSFVSVLGFSVSALRNITANISMVDLPQTGLTVSYYNKCVIDIPNGFVGYKENSQVDCKYRAGDSDTDYSFETTKAYLKCVINPGMRVNVCDKGIAK